MKTQKKHGKGNRKICAAVLAVISFCVLPSLAGATIVDISVSTDKPTYQLGEYVTISVTAYNPNPEPITLSFSGRKATYIIDDTYDLADAPFYPQVSYTTIEPYSSFTWDLTHDYWGMKEYFLLVGTHTLVGQLWAGELGEDNMTSPVQFEVIPELATFALFGLGLLIFRRLSRMPRAQF